MICRILAVILLIILFPIFLLIALAIFIDDSSPVFFLQKRLGKKGQRFNILKFRTMRNNSQQEKIRWKKNNPNLWQEYNKNNFKLKNDPRINRTGALLRKFSLDELPQLINIIKGEMTFIGPRPILLREKTAYGKSFKIYKKLTPGITCLWQISGRSNTTFKKRIAYDRLYYQKKSLCLDFYILYKTISVVLKTKGSF
jgi:exopolysaccharide production protein ExoY